MEDVQKIVGAILGIHDVPPSARLVEDLDAESMDVVNIIAALEDHYDIELDDAELGEVQTVAELAAAVEAARK